MAGLYDITEWLNLRTQFGVDFRDRRGFDYSNFYGDPASGGFIRNHSIRVSNLSSSATVNIRQTFSEQHSVFAVLGVEVRRDYVTKFEASGIQLPGDLFKVLSGASQPSSVEGQNQEYRQVGFFGKITYDYQNRYYFTVSARYDGSSRFGEKTASVFSRPCQPGGV